MRADLLTARRARALANAPRRGELALQPSILSADFCYLGRDVDAVAATGISSLHVDVMDGRYVPNISIGLPVLESLAAATDLDLDVHLMIAEPERYIDDFAAAGADAITIHAEACVHLHRCLQRIRALGLRAGVALNPGTPLSALDEVLGLCDQVLIMTVNPGFGGQSFIRSGLDKIARLRRRIDETGWPVEIQVDGGVSPATIGEVVQAGAHWLVAGSAVFAAGRPVADAVADLLAAARPEA